MMMTFDLKLSCARVRLANAFPCTLSALFTRKLLSLLCFWTWQRTSHRDVSIKIMEKKNSSRCELKRPKRSNWIPYAKIVANKRREKKLSIETGTSEINSRQANDRPQLRISNGRIVRERNVCVWIVKSYSIREPTVDVFEISWRAFVIVHCLLHIFRPRNFYSSLAFGRIHRHTHVLVPVCVCAAIVPRNRNGYVKLSGSLGASQCLTLSLAIVIIQLKYIANVDNDRHRPTSTDSDIDSYFHFGDKIEIFIVRCEMLIAVRRAVKNRTISIDFELKKWHAI